MAQVFQPVTSAKMADVNGKIIQPGDLNLKTIPYQSYDTSVAPLTGQRVARKSANVGMANVNVLDLPMHATSLMPRQNFTAKNASQSSQKAQLPDGRPAAEVLPSNAAPIPKRVIHAHTPAGERELKEQLQKLPFQQEKE